jgi:hypothetical protein
MQEVGVSGLAGLNRSLVSVGASDDEPSNQRETEQRLVDDREAGAGGKPSPAPTTTSTHTLVHLSIAHDRA